MKKITNKIINDFKMHLIEEEKSAATIEKYIRDVNAFVRWLSGRKVVKATVLEYKKILIDTYSTASVNSIISSLNSLFAFLGLLDCKIKTIKMQRQIFASNDKELTKAEYERLLELKMFRPSPSAIVETRNGLQVYWFISRQPTEYQWRKVEDYLIKTFDADS